MGRRKSRNLQGWKSAMRAFTLLVLSGILHSAASAQAADDRIVVVVSRGVGESSDAAKKDALLNAVQQVVGLYVDAETLVENESIIRDKVLTFANADVKSQEVLHAAKEGGLYRVTMKVGVVPNTLTRRLRDNAVSVRKIPG